MDRDPDRPEGAVNMSIIIEEIDLNGMVQKVMKKTYQMFDGTSHQVTTIETSK